eukprot:CAMPEP_0176453322 /NCGR_PEP_ID=MMETSP0127-20121128/29154_1 /TAXON_ID=938130 /ORGANISM="Platyophrya macrostoma, Strain WH" /LENGTH=486 /DNA_ID=CAMNT_0017842129 /DNA_START=34 /DNA_END=1494 /DNA_ORIENTATION=-
MSISFSTLVQKARPARTHAVGGAFRDVLSKLPPTNVTALKNGVRVACEENPVAKFATVGLFFGSGSAHEAGAFSGTSRVLEKCGFLGTANQSKAQIAKAIEELGGQLSVNIDRDQSYIYMKVSKENVNKAVGLLADVARNARLTDEDLAAAKKQVLSDQHDFEERPDEVVFDNMFRAAFDSTGAGLGAPLYGDKNKIDLITKDAVEKYRAGKLDANRVVVVGAGVSQSVLEKAASEFLGDLPAAVKRDVVDTRYIGGEYKLWNLRFKTAHMGWAFETCGANCEDSLPLQLATQVTGSFHRSQHELGQAQMHRVLKTFSSLDHSTPTNTHFNEKAIEVANSFLKQYGDAGLCGMYLVARPCQTGAGDASILHEILQYTMSEWCRISQKVLHQVELDQAKVNLKSQLLFNMDGSSNTAEDIGRQVLYHGRRIPLEEMYNRIDDITAANVQEVLQHYFFSRKPVFSYMGYVYPMPGYDWTHHWTYKYWY